MPQHKSAEKRLRQSKKRYKHNRQYRSRMRTMIKKVEESEDKEKAVPILNETKALLDRMAAKGLIHDNKAARYKSRLDKHVDSL
jgi:small subunit ribosomal protein S20